MLASIFSAGSGDFEGHRSSWWSVGSPGWLRVFSQGSLWAALPGSFWGHCSLLPGVWVWVLAGLAGGRSSIHAGLGISWEGGVVFCLSIKIFSWVQVASRGASDAAAWSRGRVGHRHVLGVGEAGGLERKWPPWLSSCLSSSALVPHSPGGVATPFLSVVPLGTVIFR